MGQHKIEGASLGQNYHHAQHAYKHHRVIVYRASFAKRGEKFEMQDGRTYIHDHAGSIRLAGPKQRRVNYWKTH